MRAEGNDKRDKTEASNDKTSLQSQHLNILGEILATRLATLKQTDFGMAPVTVAAGSVKVKGEAEIEFEMYYEVIQLDEGASYGRAFGASRFGQSGPR